MTAPRADVLLAAPAGTVDAGVEVTAPVAEVMLTAPAGRFGLTTGPALLQITAPAGTTTAADARVTVDVYDDTGKVHQAFAAWANGIRWQETAARPGTADVTIPLPDAAAAAIADRSIIRFSQFGDVQFACIANTEDTPLAVDGFQTLTLSSQAGLLALLNESVVYPEYPLWRRSSDTRNFGPMSRRLGGVDWWQPTAWLSAVFEATTTGAHMGLPTNLGNTSAEWMAYPPGPSHTVSFGEVQYYRFEFNVGSPIALAISHAADDYLTLWIDGEELFSPDYAADFAQWHNASTINTTIPDAGRHTLCVRVENMIYHGGHNPVGFIATVDQLGADGTKHQSITFTHEGVGWVATNQDVGWHPAQVLLQLVNEAKARGDRGVNLLAVDFTDTLDSNGNPWTTQRGIFQFPISSQGLADVAATLCESGIDVRIDPTTMTLRCFNAGGMGSDKTATVLALGVDGGSLLTYDTKKVTARATVVLSQQAKGALQETIDTAGVASFGRVETGASFGGTSSDFTEQKMARQQLALSAQPQYTARFTMTATAARGLNVGDRVTAPGHEGVGTMILRLLQRTVEAGDNPVVTFDATSSPA